MFKSISGQAAVQTLKIVGVIAAIFGFVWLIISFAPPAVVWVWLGVFWTGYMVKCLYDNIKIGLSLKAELAEKHDDNLRAGDK